MKFTFKDFQAKYPTEEACLDKIFQIRFKDMEFCPECAAKTTFYRVKKRKCYECKHCAYQVFPMAGTIFENTKTPLTKWFHALYLMTASRNGVSAKEIERHLGVTYKCAWRMAHQIRILMKDKTRHKLTGEIQVDEAYLGGHATREEEKNGKKKAVVLGMVSKEGKIIAKHIKNATSRTIIRTLRHYVAKGSHVTSDELNVYKNLPQLGYPHDVVQHRIKEFVNKKGTHTNTIEGFWSLLKRSISGTHVWISEKHLPKYLDEFEFRYNNRHSHEPMFELAFEVLRP